MTKEEKKRTFCRSCSDNFYNIGNNSPSGECWMLEKSTVVERMKVGTWQNPPYYWAPEQTLSCHHMDGMHWIKREDVRVKERPASPPTGVTP